ncbi:MAG: DUF4350 domain-containing protein [Cyclobacteriaceae bacterium]
MKQELKYYLILGAALLILILVEIFAPKPTDWRFTLHHEDKSPYGTFILYENFNYLFPEQSVSTSYKTLYEIREAYAGENILLLSADLRAGKEDTEALLQLLDSGAYVLAAAREFGGKLADTLQLETDADLLETVTDADDTLEIRESLYYFSDYDSSRAEVLAENEDGQAVLLRYRQGKGALLMSSVPQVYTNYFMLQESLTGEATASLNLLPQRDLIWNEYYHLGRMESSTPLRFVLSVAPLRWAVYLTLAGLLLFIVFESKRRQRVIPVVQPPANATLEFVETVGNVFMRGASHREMAKKKIIYFREYLLSHYRLQGAWQEEAFRERVAHKSGKTRREVDEIFDLILNLQEKKKISAEELIRLNQCIDTFYTRKAII